MKLVILKPNDKKNAEHGISLCDYNSLLVWAALLRAVELCGDEVFASSVDIK